MTLLWENSSPNNELILQDMMHLQKLMKATSLWKGFFFFFFTIQLVNMREYDAFVEIDEGDMIEGDFFLRATI